MRPPSSCHPQSRRSHHTHTGQQYPAHALMFWLAHYVSSTETTSLGSGLIRSVQHLRLPFTCYPSPHTSHNHPVELMSPPCIDHISHIHSHLRLVTATCMCSLPLVFGRLVCPGPTQHSPTLFAPIHFCFSCQPSRLGLRPAQFTRAPTCGFSPPPICTLLLCDHFCGITAVAQR